MKTMTENKSEAAWYRGREWQVGLERAPPNRGEGDAFVHYRRAAIHFHWPLGALTFMGPSCHKSFLNIKDILNIRI